MPRKRPDIGRISRAAQRISNIRLKERLARQERLRDHEGVGVSSIQGQTEENQKEETAAQASLRQQEKYENTNGMQIEHLNTQAPYCQESSKHSEPTYPCDQCSCITYTPQALQKHKLVHSGVMPYACDECDYRADKMASLKLHKHSHRKSKCAETVAEYACKYCNFKTIHQGSMKAHTYTHSTIKPFCCDKCGYTSATKQNLNSHLQTHTGEKQFACDLCDFRARLKFTLKEHRLTHFNSKPFACDLCKYRTISKPRLRMHQKIHNKEKQPKNNGEKPKRGPPSKNEKVITDVDMFIKISEDKRPKTSHIDKFWDIDNDLISDVKIKKEEDEYSDFLCNAESEEKTNFVDPLSLACNTQSYNNAAQSSNTLNAVKGEGEQSYDNSPDEGVPRIPPSILSLYPLREENDSSFDFHQDDGSDKGNELCNQENDNFYAEEILKIEYVGTQDKKTFCEKCGNFFKKRSYLKYHIQSKHSDITYPCDKCSFKTSTPQALEKHKVIHSDVKPFGCDQCDYTAISKKYVQLHQKFHVKEKKLTCDICDFKTKYPQSLRTHKLFHSGIKKHMCSKCNFVGRLKANLRNHMLLHSDKKPFKCDHCTFSTKTKRRLKTHILQHGEKSLGCGICDYKCSVPAFLREHMQIHKTEKSFSCGQCNYKTAVKHYLRKHERTRHKADKL